VEISQSDESLPRQDPASVLRERCPVPESVVNEVESGKIWFFGFHDLNFVLVVVVIGSNVVKNRIELLLA